LFSRQSPERRDPCKFHAETFGIITQIIKIYSVMFGSLEGHEGMLTKVLFLDVKSLQVNSLDTLDKKKVT